MKQSLPSVPRRVSVGPEEAIPKDKNLPFMTIGEMSFENPRETARSLNRFFRSSVRFGFLPTGKQGDLWGGAGDLGSGEVAVVTQGFAPPPSSGGTAGNGSNGRQRRASMDAGEAPAWLTLPKGGAPFGAGSQESDPDWSRPPRASLSQLAAPTQLTYRQ